MRLYIMTNKTLATKIEDAIKDGAEYVKINAYDEDEKNNIINEIKTLGFKAYIVQRLKTKSFMVVVDI